MRSSLSCSRDWRVEIDSVDKRDIHAAASQLLPQLVNKRINKNNQAVIGYTANRSNTITDGSLVRCYSRDGLYHIDRNEAIPELSDDSTHIANVDKSPPLLLSIVVNKLALKNETMEGQLTVEDVYDKENIKTSGGGAYSKLPQIKGPPYHQGQGMQKRFDKDKIPIKLKVYNQMKQQHTLYNRPVNYLSSQMVLGNCRPKRLFHIVNKIQDDNRGMNEPENVLEISNSWRNGAIRNSLPINHKDTTDSHQLPVSSQLSYGQQNRKMNAIRNSVLPYSGYSGISRRQKDANTKISLVKKIARSVENGEEKMSVNDNEELLVPPDVDEELSSDEIKERNKQLMEKAALLSAKEEDKRYLVNFEPDQKIKVIVNKLRGGTGNTLQNLTDEVRDDYNMFLNQVDAVTYYANRQAEEILRDYTPRALVIISSGVPKAHVLQSATLPHVLSFVYDVVNDTYQSILDKVKLSLNGYVKGAKARHLAIVCKGAPGYLYILQGKPITPIKLLKDTELLKFWKTLGSYMSKISLDYPSVVHLMECNVAGNRQGIELLSNLESAMYAHKVKVSSPLELEPKGREMISTYFFPEKFKMWKSTRYTKIKLF